MARHLLQHETVLIADLLRKVCTPMGDNRVAYNDGWSDQRVMGVLHDTTPGINNRHVQRLRQKILGYLPGEEFSSHLHGTQPRSPGPPPVSDNSAINQNRVEGLTLRMDRLERDLVVCNNRRIRLKDRVDKLSTALIQLYVRLGEKLPEEDKS